MSRHPTKYGDGGITLTLYVRTPVAGERTVAIDRLHDLDRGDHIDGFEVETVREEVILQGGDDSGVAAIATWETTELRPAFEVRSGSTRTGRDVRRVVFPELCLAVHADGDLVCVFPCTDGDRSWTVVDFLDSYEDARAFPPDLEPALPD